MLVSIRFLKIENKLLNKNKTTPTSRRESLEVEINTAGYSEIEEIVENYIRLANYFFNFFNYF